MTTKQLAPAAPKDLREMLALPSIRARFEGILGKKAQAFASSIISVSQASKALQECDPASVIAGAALAASLDLPIIGSLGQSCLVPYKSHGSDVGKAQFQIMARGFVQLALRSGQYKTMNAAEVHEGEIISRNRLTGEIDFNPDGKESGKIVGFLFYFKLINGFEKYTYMTVEECQAHGKRYSKSYGSDTGKWKTDFNAMALKTVVKQGLSKWGPLSTEMQTAIQFDQAAVDEECKPDYIDSTAEVKDARPAEPIPGPTEAPPASRPTHPTEQMAEPVTFHPGIVTRKGVEFCIPNGKENFYTLDEDIAKFAKLANTNGLTIKVLLDVKQGKKWIAGVDR